MKLKDLLLGTIVGSTPLAAGAAKTDSVSDQKPLIKEVKDKSQPEKDSVTTVDYSDVKISTNDSSVQKQELINHKKGFDNFKKSEYDMLCLVAHFETLKGLVAYEDKASGRWTIGFGNCYKPDGTPVKKGDRIKSKEELLYYFESFVDKYLYPNMDKYLPLHLMSKAEIAVIGSLCYNYGPGILSRKEGGKLKPSVFSEKLTEYFKTHSEESKEYIKTYMRTHNTVKGKPNPALTKRRDLETRIFFGEIVMDNHNELNLENSVNFSEVSLGGVYNFRDRLPSDTAKVIDMLKSSAGRNLNDSIDYAIKHPVPSGVGKVYKKKPYRPRKGVRGR